MDSTVVDTIYVVSQSGAAEIIKALSVPIIIIVVALVFGYLHHNDKD